jgi:hypothetical protein
MKTWLFVLLLIPLGSFSQEQRGHVQVGGRLVVDSISESVNPSDSVLVIAKGEVMKRPAGILFVQVTDEEMRAIESPVKG